MLLAVVLVVAGPERLPALARKIARIIAFFRRASDNFLREMMSIDSAQEPPPPIPHVSAHEAAEETAPSPPSSDAD